MDRRHFLSWAGVGVLASSLPVAIAACTPQKSEPLSQGSASPSPESASPLSSPSPKIDASARTDGFVAVGTIATLDAVGYITNPKFSAGPLIVIRNPSNKDDLVAVNATCPHEGCIVDWKTDDQAFICPCHASAFAMDGAVKKGPAKQPLKLFAAKIDGGSIFVKA